MTSTEPVGTEAYYDEAIDRGYYGVEDGTGRAFREEGWA